MGSPDEGSVQVLNHCGDVSQRHLFLVQQKPCFRHTCRRRQLCRPEAAEGTWHLLALESKELSSLTARDVHYGRFIAAAVEGQQTVQHQRK